MSDGRKYEFTWDLLGDLNEGRPNLGPTTRLEVYRLMQFCLRDVLEKNYGAQATDKVFYDAGYLAGRHFYKQMMGKDADLNAFVKTLQSLLKDMNIGVLRIEEYDEQTGKIVLTVSEDLDCSGLPELDYEICVYDEGFIAGILDMFTGNKYSVKEIDCWCTGDRTCRFLAVPQKA
jgi:predicted hydrocarbon binding protein